MLASLFNRKVLAFFLVVVFMLLLATLYKMQAFATFFKLELEKAEEFRPPSPWQTKRPSPILTTTTRPSPILTTTTRPSPILTTTTRPSPILTTILRTKEEQQKAGQKLYNLMVAGSAQYVCKNIIPMRNRVEGVWHYCADPGFDIAPPCLVYSFGINYDFAFDDAFGNRGCEVFSFDPSMKTKDHRRSEHVMFFNTGLGGSDNDSFVPRLDSYVREKTTWRMRTLKTLMKELGHLNRTIDLLKIDIETSEWPVAENLLQSGAFSQVKQFLVEWHIFPGFPPREAFGQMASMLETLKEHNMHLFHKNPHQINTNWDHFNLQSDMGYVNLNFIKS